MNAATDTGNQLLERARWLAARNLHDEAQDEYRRLLELQPGHAEALAYLGSREMANGNAPAAVALLDEACAQVPGNAQMQFMLGNANVAAGKLDAACAAFARSVASAPNAFLSRLLYAQALQASGRDADALVQFYSAITHAQREGRWLSDATTAPALRESVKNAMHVVQQGRRKVFDALLGPLLDTHGANAMRRVEKCLRIYLGEIPAHYPDPRQKPLFLYFPDLPPTTYFDRGLFDWYAQLEASSGAIRDEMQRVIARPEALKPFLGTQDAKVTQAYLGGIENPVWNAYFFHRHGERYDDHHAQCPATSAALAAVPSLVHIREHAPEACFSVLTPGTHILKHRGVTNTRLVTHLPLVIPEKCAINVGGDEKVWRFGEVFSFDDTFEHEAWNRSDQVRVVMLMDVWNPYLTEVEREAVTRLVEGIGDFNAAAGLDRS